MSEQVKSKMSKKLNIRFVVLFISLFVLIRLSMEFNAIILRFMPAIAVITYAFVKLIKEKAPRKLIISLISWIILLIAAVYLGIRMDSYFITNGAIVFFFCVAFVFLISIAFAFEANRGKYQQKWVKRLRMKSFLKNVYSFVGN